MNTDITHKTYKKLVVQVSLSGLSFAVFDTIVKKPTQLTAIPFESVMNHESIEKLFEQVFLDNVSLQNKYDECLVLHSNSLSTFVPQALFDEDFIGSYLQYNTKVFDTDFFTYDELQNYQMNNVYIPYVNMNNFFIDKFGSFDYKHSATVLVSKLLDLSKNIDDKKMYVHVVATHFEIVVVQNQKLLFYNTFEYKTPEDFIYYILFTAEQLQLNPENFVLEFLGEIEETSPLYAMTYKYVRNVLLYKPLETNNSFTEEENRRHFILTHA